MMTDLTPEQIQLVKSRANEHFRTFRNPLKVRTDRRAVGLRLLSLGFFITPRAYNIFCDEIARLREAQK